MRMVAIFVLYFSVFSASNSPRWDRNPHSTSTAGHLALAIMLISGDTEAATRRLLGQSSPLSASCQAAAAFAAGRASYVAFYLTGDVMNTGLSIFFILTCVALVLAVALSIAAMAVVSRKAR